MVMTSPRSIDHAGQTYPLRPRRFIYSRLSTDHQTMEYQERESHAIADRMGWTVGRSIGIKGSGRGQAREKPARVRRAVQGDASRRQFDLIAAWSVDRLGRSLQDPHFLTEHVHAPRAQSVPCISKAWTYPSGRKASPQHDGVFAEFERVMIQERGEVGLERARAQVTLGGGRGDGGCGRSRPSARTCVPVARGSSSPPRQALAKAWAPERQFSGSRRR